jgi:nucleotide-binding universal stress UspA family protein
MVEVKNILVPIDAEEGTARTLDYARALATAFGAALHVLCIVPDAFGLPWAPEAPDTALAELQAHMERDARAYLETLLTPADRERLRGRLTTCVGHPASEILEYVEGQGIDLIVIGDGVRTPPAPGMPAGCGAEVVARQASCPTLIVPRA